MTFRTEIYLIECNSSFFNSDTIKCISICNIFLLYVDVKTDRRIKFNFEKTTTTKGLRTSTSNLKIN